MNLPEPATPREAEMVWNSIQDPSTRRVAKALSQAGRRVHHSTIARWRSEGWRPVPTRPHPVETARRTLDVVVPLLTADATVGVEAFLERQNRREKLDALPDDELLRQAAREALIVVALLFWELQRQTADLVVPKITETAMLLSAIAATLEAATDGFAQASHIRDRDG